MPAEPGREVAWGGLHVGGRNVDTSALHVAPVPLGAGERLFDGVDLSAFRSTELVASPAAAHFSFRSG